MKHKITELRADRRRLNAAAARRRSVPSGSAVTPKTTSSAPRRSKRTASTSTVASSRKSGKKGRTSALRGRSDKPVSGRKREWPIRKTWMRSLFQLDAKKKKLTAEEEKKIEDDTNEVSVWAVNCGHRV